MAHPEHDSRGPLQGEGDYEAARRFRKEQERFANSGKVGKRAHEAEASLTDAEGLELEAARHAAARGEALKPPKKGGARSK